MANQGILAQSKPTAATDTILYSAPVDSSASTVLNVANDGTGSAYSVGIKSYDQKLTVDASTYLLHKGDVISGYTMTVNTPFSNSVGFTGGTAITSDDGEKTFKFESPITPAVTTYYVKTVGIRVLTLTGESGTFSVGDTLTKGAAPDDTTATVYGVNGALIYVGPSTINGAGTEFTAGDSVSATSGGSGTIDVGGINPSSGSENKYVFSETSGGTYNLYLVSDTPLPLFNDRTYRFDVSDASMLNSAFALSTTQNGEWGPDGDATLTDDNGVEYTDGRTDSGTPGNASAYIQFAFTSGTPTALYWYSSDLGDTANADFGALGSYISTDSQPTFSEFYIYDVTGTWVNSSDSFTFSGITYTVTAQSAGPFGYVESYSGTTLTVIKGEGSTDFAGTDTFLDAPLSATASRSTVTVSSVDIASAALDTDNYIVVGATNSANNVDKITSLVVGPGETIIVNSTTANNVFSLIGFEDASSAITTRTAYQNPDLAVIS